MVVAAGFEVAGAGSVTGGPPIESTAVPELWAAAAAAAVGSPCGPPIASVTAPGSCAGEEIVAVGAGGTAAKPGSAGAAMATRPPRVLTMSATTGASVSAEATAEATGVAAKGSLEACCWEPGGTAEYESLTAGIRRRTTRRPCCAPGVEAARAVGGTSAGAWIFGTASGGSHTPATRTLGSGAT